MVARLRNLIAQEMASELMEYDTVIARWRSGRPLEHPRERAGPCRAVDAGQVRGPVPSQSSARLQAAAGTAPPGRWRHPDESTASPAGAEVTARCLIVAVTPATAVEYVFPQSISPRSFACFVGKPLQARLSVSCVMRRYDHLATPTRCGSAHSQEDKHLAFPQLR